jgi:hypothetical protein
MLLQKQWDVLWIVLRFAYNMVGIRGVGNFLICGPPFLLISLANSADASLTSLYLGQLLDKMSATCASISCFRRTMFQFTLGLPQS